MGSGLWVFWSFLFISNLWIILFPLIYSACYKEITKDILSRFQNIHETKQSNKTPQFADKPTKSSSWYLSEISKNKNLAEVDKPFRNIYQRLVTQRRMMTQLDLEARVEGYLELILHMEEMIAAFNAEFGERLLLEMIFCIVFIIVYSFYICFWIGKGQIFVIVDMLTPIYMNGKKLVELGYSCGNISREAQTCMNTLVGNVPLDKLSLGLTRKVGLCKKSLQN